MTSSPVYRSDSLPLKHLLWCNFDELQSHVPDKRVQHQIPQFASWMNSTVDIEQKLYNNRGVISRIYSAYRRNPQSSDQFLFETAMAVCEGAFHKDYLKNLNLVFQDISVSEKFVHRRLRLEDQPLVVSEQTIAETIRIVDLDDMSHHFILDAKLADPTRNFNSSFLDNTTAGPDSDIFNLFVGKDMSTSLDRPIIKATWFPPSNSVQDKRFNRNEKALDLGVNNGRFQRNFTPSAAEVLAFAEWLVDTTYQCQHLVRSNLDFDSSPEVFYRDFSNFSCIRRMLTPDRLHQSFAFLAKLPTDAISSVTALYECLHFIASRICPEVTWKFELLLSGFLLPNVLGRSYHTYAIKLTLTNFARLALCRRYPKVVAPL